MKKARQVLIVTRHFWPTINDGTLRLVHWVERLNAAGVRTQILTSRSNSTWSSRFQYDQTPVIRLRSSPSSPFRSHRYIRDVQEQVAKFTPEMNLIYLDNVDLEAIAIVNKWKPPARPPIVVRYDLPVLSRAARGGWQPSKSVVDTCRKVSAIIAPCAASHQNLLATGIVQTPILRIEDWHGRCLDRSLGARRAARQILSSINHELYVRATDLVILCPGELSRSWGVELLIDALKGILERNRRIKLWILGDGPERGAIYRRLEMESLHRIVAMPGIFTELESVLQVADLCIFPAVGQGLSWLAPSCAASNIPMILADSPQARRFSQDNADTMLFSGGSETDLRCKVESWLRDATPLTRAALELQSRILAQQEQSTEMRELMSLIDPPVTNAVGLRS